MTSSWLNLFGKSHRLGRRPHAARRVIRFAYGFWSTFSVIKRMPVNKGTGAAYASLRPSRVMACYRGDGVGRQALLRLCIMQLAEDLGADYVHLPFARIAHRPDDIVRSQWVAKWESFLNLGHDAVRVADILPRSSALRIAALCAWPNTQLARPVEELDQLRPAVGETRAFGWEVCRWFIESPARIRPEVIERARKNWKHGKRDCARILEASKVNIAIHIRRGDHWHNVMSRVREGVSTKPILDQDHYVLLIQRIAKLFLKTDLVRVFHVFSDGDVDDFDQFPMKGDGVAYLPGQDEDAQILFHLKSSPFDTFNALVNADIFVPSRSSFAVVAMALNENQIVTDEAIRGAGLYRMFDDWLSSSETCFDITELENSSQQLELLRHSLIRRKPGDRAVLR